MLISREGRRFRETAYWRSSRCLDFQPLLGPLAVQVDIFPPDHRRRDIDNVQKALLDVLSARRGRDCRRQPDRPAVHRTRARRGRQIHRSHPDGLECSRSAHTKKKRKLPFTNTCACGTTTPAW